MVICMSSSEEPFGVARLLCARPLVFGWHDLDVVLDEADDVLLVRFLSGTKSSSSSVDDKPMTTFFLVASFLASVYKKHFFFLLFTILLICCIRGDSTFLFMKFYLVLYLLLEINGIYPADRCDDLLLFVNYLFKFVFLHECLQILG